MVNFSGLVLQGRARGDRTGMNRRKCRISRKGGDIVIVLRANGARPMEGVLSTLRGAVVAPEPRDDESVVCWRLSPETISGCVFYGVVTPLGRTFFAPKYERTILQDDVPLTGLPNPSVVTTRKLNPGEWIGPPEAVRFEG